MELYMACVLMAIALAMLIIKGIHFFINLNYKLPSKELKWRRSPKLPSQDLEEKRKKKKSSSASPKRSKDRETKKTHVKELLAHAEIQMESISIEESPGHRESGTVV